MKFDCAVFDLDGTLTDSQSLWIQTRLDVLAMHGIHATPDDISYMIEMELPDGSAAMSRDFPIGLTPREVADLTLSIMTRYYAESVPLKPGAGELLRRLHDMGVVCCLATASVEERFMPMLRRLEVDHLLDHIVTTHQVGHNKHHPDVYLEAARRAGCAPARTLVVEDTLYCVRAAREAGFLTLGVHEPASEGTPEEMAALCTWFTRDMGHLPQSFWQD